MASTVVQHCKDCNLYFDTSTSLNLHLNYHKDHLLIKWPSQYNNTENNNNILDLDTRQISNYSYDVLNSNQYYKSSSSSISSEPQTPNGDSGSMSSYETADPIPVHFFANRYCKIEEKESYYDNNDGMESPSNSSTSHQSYSYDQQHTPVNYQPPSVFNQVNMHHIDEINSHTETPYHNTPLQTIKTENEILDLDSTCVYEPFMDAIPASTTNEVLQSPTQVYQETPSICNPPHFMSIQEPTATEQPSSTSQLPFYLRKHKTRRPKIHPCISCNKWFISKTNLTTHYQTILHKKNSIKERESTPASPDNSTISFSEESCARSDDNFSFDQSYSMNNSNTASGSPNMLTGFREASTVAEITSGNLQSPLNHYTHNSNTIFQGHGSSFNNSMIPDTTFDPHMFHYMRQPQSFAHPLMPFYHHHHRYFSNGPFSLPPISTFGFGQPPPYTKDNHTTPIDHASSMIASSIDSHVTNNSVDVEKENETVLKKEPSPIKHKGRGKKSKEADGYDTVHKCIDCNKSFLKAGYLTQHNKSFHSGQKPYKCSTCGKRFKEDYLYEKHLSKHDIDKPYKCILCPKQFIYNTDYRRHLYIHTGQFPHRCKICNKGFVRKDQMLKHCDTHRRKLVIPSG